MDKNGLIGSKMTEVNELVDEKAMQSVVDNYLLAKYHNQINLIVTEMVEKNKSIEALIDEVKDKKSNLTRSCREVLTNFKPEVLKIWTDKYLQEGGM